MDLFRLDRSDAAYPTALDHYLGKDAPLSVAALADGILIPYAGPSSKTEQFCRETLAWNKPVYTFSHTSNKNLITLGARPLTPGEEVEITLRSLERS